MTDEAYDAQTLATSARIERLHILRFGPQKRFWICDQGHANHGASTICVRGSRDRVRNMPRSWDGLIEYPFYGQSDPEELIYSRAN